LACKLLFLFPLSRLFLFTSAGGIFDFALYFFHNAKELLARGSGPYFYLVRLRAMLDALLIHFL